MRGACAGSADVMCTSPRDSGFRLQTLAVKASNACSGSPKASSDNGCTWYCRLGQRRPGSERVKAPSCDGAMLIGPLRESAYSAAMRALPSSVADKVLSVRVLSTAKTARTCKWSCRLPPTPGSSWRGATPTAFRRVPSPMPDSCRICGEPTAPADSSTSPRQRTCTGASVPTRSSTPRATSLSFEPAGASSSSSRVTCAPVSSCRFARFSAGRRKPLAAFQRTPRRWLTSK